jgi:hypothetical protein
MSQATTEPLPRLVDAQRSLWFEMTQYIMVLAGFVLLTLGVIMFMSAEDTVKEKLNLAGEDHEPAKVQRLVRLERALHAGQAGVGLALVILGLAISRAPLFCSVTANVLFLAHLVVSLVLGEPDVFRRVRFVIALFLLNSILSALAYRRDLRRAAQEPEIFEGELISAPLIPETGDTVGASTQPEASLLPPPTSTVATQAITGHQETDRAPGSSRIEIVARQPIPWFGLLCCLAALGLLGFSAHTGQTMYAWWAVAPALASLALLASRPGPFRAILHDTALEILQPRPVTISWETIQALVPAGIRLLNRLLPPSSNYPIGVVHSQGSFEIPRHTNLPSDQLLGLLLERIPSTGGQNLPPRLVPYWQAQVRLWGKGGVYTYCSREEIGMPWYRRKRILLLALAALATAAIWIGGADWNEIKVAGMLLGFLGVVGLLVSSPISRWISRMKNSGLVVSPRGFAVLQKPFIGHASWREVVGISWESQPDLSLIGRHAIVVTVKEQKIPIYDIYDRPLMTIYRQMHYYWRGVEPGAGLPAA